MAESPGSPNISEKYQRLASEYARLRAQIPILKKGVLDEQGKSKKLHDDLNSSEQNYRRAQQEIETLTIRNKQLSVRVDVLQEEATNAANSKHGSKSKHKGHSNHSDPNAAQAGAQFKILTEELESKIQQNAVLHSQLSELKQQFEYETRELRDSITRLEDEAQRSKTQQQDSEKKMGNSLEQANDDRAVLQVKLITREKELEQQIGKFEALQREHEAFVERAGALTNGALNPALSPSISVVEEKSMEDNTLDLPSQDHAAQSKLRTTMENCLGAISRVLRGLSDWHSHSAARLQLSPLAFESSTAEETSTLLELLLSGSEILKPVVEFAGKLHKEAVSSSAAAESLGSTTIEAPISVSDLKEMANHIVPYIEYWSQLHSSFVAGLEKENDLSTCTNLIKSQNGAITNCLKDNFLPALQVLQSLFDNSNDAFASPKEYVSRICQCSSQFHLATKELASSINKKISLEQALPTTSQQMKQANELVATGIVKVAAQSGKLAQELNSAQAALETELSRLQITKRYSHLLPLLQAAAAGYTAAVRLDGVNAPQQGIPYSQAVNLQNTAEQSAMSKEAASKQADRMQERMAKLEADREHWMLEAQLLSVRLQRAGSGAGDASEEKMDPPTEGETGTREELIREHLSERLKEAGVKLYQADSHAAYWEAEGRAALSRLLRVEELAASRAEEMAQMRDALETTQRSMGDQLNAMTEHMVKLSEELALKEEDLDRARERIKTTDNMNLSTSAPTSGSKSGGRIGKRR